VGRIIQQRRAADAATGLASGLPDALVAAAIVAHLRVQAKNE